MPLCDTIRLAKDARPCTPGPGALAYLLVRTLLPSFPLNLAGRAIAPARAVGAKQYLHRVQRRPIR